MYQDAGEPKEKPPPEYHGSASVDDALVGSPGST